MLKDTASLGLCVRVRPPHTFERRGGGGCEQGAREEEWTGGATTPHPSMLRLIRIAAVLAAARPTLLFGHCRMPRAAKEADSDSEMNPGGEQTLRYHSLGLL